MERPPANYGYRWAATGVTLLGLGLAVAAAGLAVVGRLPGAFVLLIGAGLADLFDGWVARRTGTGGSPLGVQLDSLVDVASFGIVPIILVLAARDAAPGGTVGGLELGVAWVYVSCAVLRLARFNARVDPGPGPETSYRGVPVTYAALVFPLVYGVGESLPGVGSAGLLLLATAVLALLFVTPLPVPKPRGVAYPLFVLLAVVVAVYLVLVVAPGASP